jgi:multiple sugar transport system ATP-binding protein
MAEIVLSNVSKIFDGGQVGVQGIDLTVPDGEFLCILGPSGCGKSTTLRMLAGLEMPTCGTIFIGGRDVSATPTEKRDIAMVFENYALYPHLTVRQNIAMPLVARGTDKAQVRKKVDEVGALLNISEHLDKKSSLLSGGQKQRVSIGRALIRNPKVLLLDEPLGHLEAYLRARLRSELRDIQMRTGVTSILITHDQEEAAALADRVALMRAGVIQQVGTFEQLYKEPKTRFVAEFIGHVPCNFISSSATSDGRGLLIESENDVYVDMRQRSCNLQPGQSYDVGVRPYNLHFSDSPSANRFPARVRVVEPQGAQVVVLLDAGALGAQRAIVEADIRPKEGQLVHCEVRADELFVFNRDGINILAA